ncbi:PAS domain S-box [Synechococcus sp. PCC 7502]|uniref:ATP-binding protein n=1 Tax=Synechococcus sp. PCC 7502 TaxID=1173263 RepID=UPI00029FBB1F|nr:ATP-binding protein [Synechococcus sp. PCC 7502]AFY73116.1 PAS domain S-box [Synechococcus sp. PCC 7502]
MNNSKANLKTNLQAKFKQPKIKVPLLFILAVPFISQVLLAMGVVSYLSIKNGQESIKDIAQQLGQSLGDRIDQNLENYLSIPKQINQTNLNAVKLKLLDIKNLKTWEKYLWQQVQIYPTVNFISVGNYKGEYRTGERLADGSFRINVVDPVKITQLGKKTINRNFYSFKTNALGDRTTGSLIMENFDPTKWSFYQKAVAAGKTTWSDPYISLLEPTLLISAVTPIYEQNQPVGVINTALRLDGIGSYLRNLKVGGSGQAFIMDKNGILIATSTAELPFRVQGGQGRELFKAVNSTNALTKAVANAVDSYGNSQSNTMGQMQLNFDQKAYFLQVIPVTNNLGLNWLTVVIIPESDFMEQIEANRNNLILVYVITAIAISIVAWFTSRWISFPILKIVNASREIADGNLDAKISPQRIKELDLLAHSYNYMSEQLQNSFADLGEALDNLELKVEQRTWQLQRAERKYRSMFENSVEGIFQTTPAGYYINANPALVKILGYDSREDLMVSLQDLNHNLYVLPNRRHEFEQLISQYGEVNDFESRVYRKDRSIIWISETARMVKDSDNEILFYEGTVQDITTRKAIEGELQTAIQTAETANQAKSAFLANMSHELRTPLNAILGFTQVLIRDRSLNAEQQENLNIISRSGEHLLNLINDVLDMSKIEAGKMTLQEDNFNLKEMLDSLVQMMRLRAETKNLELICDYGIIPHYVIADERKLRQVLLNLLSNAVKFTEAGSITLQVDQDQDFLHFAVQDTGLGIAIAEQERLFTAFSQTASSHAQEGTGLGLAISQKLVQLMHGHISVTSQVGVGSRFEFSIPLKIGNALEVEANLPQSQIIGLEPNQPVYRILSVDDRLENRKLITKLLTPLGFEVKEASNGQEAIDLWATWSPHLICMDMRMPIMDGYAATEYIKSHLKGQATIIIALTASVLEEERVIVMSSGCDDFIRKPFREETLLTKIAAHLGVKYAYSNANPESQEQVIPTERLTSREIADLMPETWITNLKLAAQAGDDEAIMQLIGEISSESTEYTDLRYKLMELIENFNFEAIANLASSINLNKS